MTEKISFKVSARTARLIGRENVATSKGAVIELVKNGYDADSSFSLVLIDNRDATYHEKISVSEYNLYIEKGLPKTLLNEVYHYDISSNAYLEKSHIAAENLEQLKLKLRELVVIYIIDNGDGMTSQVIRDHWMTIGTDNKAGNIMTRNGRVKVGAKGIGRFALDKLGSKCEMMTFFNPEVYKYDYSGTNAPTNGSLWVVDWDDFEGTDKTIDSINATLDTIEGISYSQILHSLPLNDDILKALEEFDLSHGTILKIMHPREAWDSETIGRIYDDLGVLLPPAESNEFAIFLYATETPREFGRVEPTVCDDYDYKLEAHADDQQNVSIRIYRNENDTEAIPVAFFKREKMQAAPYTLEDFKRGYWETSRTFRELCPGFADVDIDHVFDKVGRFDFTFYYLKRTTNSKEEKRFFYKPCAYNLRKTWLEKYGGIKLFRDKFRVRPYGERRDSAFDWLGLGARKAKSPAGIAKSNGGYKVEPENIAGLVKISRVFNEDFDDKSSREGLQENKTFLLFEELIRGLISIFEEDRSYIARELDAFDRERNWDARTREEAERLVQEILRQRDEQRRNDEAEDDQQQKDYNAHLELLAESVRQKEEELAQMHEEQKMLRVLASSGLMLASFSHDLSKLNITLDTRYQKIERLFESKVNRSEFDGVEDRKNPFYLLQDAKNTDNKIQSWLNFATGVIKKDKRKRSKLFLTDYFSRLRETWSSFFQSRAITFDFKNEKNISMRVFEIDMDSIFHNLFSNSIEAFNLMKVDRPRTINITVTATDKQILIEYRDSGTGLSPDIHNPNDIFKPFFTTRRNPTTGEEIGTGLGMWIVKGVLEENDADAVILNHDNGFGIRFVFPIKYSR